MGNKIASCLNLVMNNFGMYEPRMRSELTIIETQIIILTNLIQIVHGHNFPQLQLVSGCETRLPAWPVERAEVGLTGCRQVSASSGRSVIAGNNT